MKYKEIYDHAFSHAEYNSSNVKHEPSYHMIKKWIDEHPTQTIIDIGAGRGLILKELLIDFSYLDITAVDVGKYHDLPIKHIEMDMINEDKQGIIGPYDLLISNGVLEHIEESQLENVIQWHSTICRHAFISVANHIDDLCGYRLHVTNKPIDFWTELLAKYFTITYTHNIQDIWFFYILQPINQGVI